MKKIMLNLAEAAYPIPGFIRKELCAYLKEVHRFPHSYGELEKAIAREFRVRKENVVLTNGAHEGIELVARVFGRKTLVFTPAYIEYAWAAQRNNLGLGLVNAVKEKEFVVNSSEPKLGKATLIFLANPNNPFGFTEMETVEELLRNTRGVLALDETYQWFRGNSAAPLVGKHKNLIVIGSFSKSLALAGMRVGYIIAPGNLLKKLKEKLVMFRVSALSVQAALVCLKYKGYFKKTIKETVKDRKKFEGWLEGKGFNVYRTDNNNAVIRFSTVKKATAFTRHLEKKGIIVLQGNGISTVGLNDSFVRITIGNKKEMAVVRKAINEFCQKSL